MSAGHGIALRAASETDQEFLHRVYAESRAEELAATDWTAAKKGEFCRDQFEAQDKYYRENYPTCQYLIVEREGIPIGRLYRDRWDEEIRIVDLALLTSERGRGIGGALMQAVIDEARQHNIKVSIHVEATNPAQRLYKRLGFKRVEAGEVYDFLIWKWG